MSRSSKKSLSASAYRNTVSDFDAAREVVWSNLRAQLAEVLSDDSRDFQERLLDVLADVKTAALVASVRNDPTLVEDDALSREIGSVLSAARWGPGATSIRPSLGQSLVGRGWHQPEPTGPDSYGRWSGPGSLSSIFIPRLDAGTYWVEGTVHFFLPDEAVDGFRVRLGAEFGAPEMMPLDEGKWVFRILLEQTQDARSSFSRLEFFCSAMASPSEKGSGDSRRIGFFLSDVNIFKS